MTLNDKLHFIGIKVNKNTSSTMNADLESTFLEAALLCPKDHRLASLLFSWLNVHGNYIIVDKLRKLVAQNQISTLQRNWITALAIFGKKHCSHKWKMLVSAPNKDEFLLPESISKSAIKLKGAEEWLSCFHLLLPKNSLRIRDSDIKSAAELIKVNNQYRNRYLYGPSWRADIITAIQEGINTPSSISKKIGCSYEPAHRIFQEYLLATRL